MQLFSIRQRDQITIKKKGTFNNPILAKNLRAEKLLHVIECLDLLEQTLQLLIKLMKLKESIRKEAVEYFFKNFHQNN